MHTHVYAQVYLHACVPASVSVYVPIHMSAEDAKESYYSNRCFVDFLSATCIITRNWKSSNTESEYLRLLVNKEPAARSKKGHVPPQQVVNRHLCPKTYQESSARLAEGKHVTDVDR